MTGKPIEVRVPVALAPLVARQSMLRVLRSISDDFSSKDRWSLTLFLRDLHVAVIGEVAVPIGVSVEERDQRWECALEIHAVANEGFFPTFSGTLSVSPVGTHAELWLMGTYRPPLGALGAFLDNTVLRRAAQRSLSAFLSRIALEMASDVASRERTHERDIRQMHG